MTAFNNNEIIVNNHKIPVGRSYKQEFDALISSVSRNKLL
jgi:hypothetical protein